MSKLCFILGLCVYSQAYENIALKKPAHQQFPYNHIGIITSLVQASNAVDGLKTNLSVWGGQCVVSENEKYTATWWVNLTSILTIHHITIYYRTGNALWGPTNGFTPRFLGFSLYVSNTTDRSDGVLCFHDNRFTLNTIPAVLNSTCPVHGQYVIYYNERLPGVTYPGGYSNYAYNELCEVEVYGCPLLGFYGFHCSKQCPDQHCKYCHIETGTCQGCKPGYHGHRCELVCTPGFYGDGCLNKCGPCAEITQCNHVDGTCMSGCKPGYKGYHCTLKCASGFYGQSCKFTCGKCSDSGSCHHKNGTCFQGCETGYQPPLCSKECQNNKYGTNCSEPCGKCRDSSPCHHVNGSCMGGCDPGYQGEKCITECDYGYYGFRCLQECSTFCKASRDCHHVTGSCINGCKSGWQGNDCFEVLKTEDWKSSFYGMLGAFCITLVLIGLLIAYIMMTRNRRKRKESSTKPQQYEQAKPMENRYHETYENEAVNNAYQELGDFNQQSTNYSTLSPVDGETVLN